MKNRNASSLQKNIPSWVNNAACCIALLCLVAPHLLGQGDVKRQLSDIRASLLKVRKSLDELAKPEPAPIQVPEVLERKPTVPAPSLTPVLPPSREVLEEKEIPEKKDSVAPNDIPVSPKTDNASPLEEPAVLPIAPVAPPVETSKPEEVSSLPQLPLLPRNYFMPFVAWVLPMDGDWESISLGKFELEEDNGFSAGFRLGREFSWGLLEFEMKGFSNSYRSLKLTPSPVVSGRATGGSMLGNLGGRLALTEKSSLFAGFGLGFAYLQNSITIGGNPNRETGNAFAYQSFLGLEHSISRQLEAFLRYKFFGTSDLDHYSGRRMHELEAGLGFLF